LIEAQRGTEVAPVGGVIGRLGAGEDNLGGHPARPAQLTQQVARDSMVTS
jgi:hypothetical protein